MDRPTESPFYQEKTLYHKEWVWQQTESATAIALILVFYQLPQIATALFSGILVDRFSRKHL